MNEIDLEELLAELNEEEEEEMEESLVFLPVEWVH